jgi:hypothetical protein
MSTQRITKEYSKEEWDAMSHEERDEAAIEHGKKAAHVTERVEAWKRFQDSEHFDSLCAQVAEINEKKGKTPAKQTSLPPVRSHEDMALEIERLEQKKRDKAQKKQKAQEPQETQEVPEVPQKPPRRLEPVGPAFDKVDKNGDGVIDREECPICFSTTNTMATCHNGHMFCENCMLDRIKAVYDEGRLAFRDDDTQKCFICRCDMGDSDFSDNYGKLLQCVVLNGCSKGRNISTKRRNEIYHKMVRAREEERLQQNV